MSGEKIFYMVIERTVTGAYKWATSSTTERKARECADGLAHDNPGSRFYIVRAQEYFEATDVANIILLYPQEDTDGKES